MVDMERRFLATSKACFSHLFCKAQVLDALAKKILQLYVGGPGVAKTTGVVKEHCDKKSCKKKKTLVLASTTTSRRQAAECFLSSDRTPEQRNLVRILGSRHLSPLEESRTLQSQVSKVMATQNNAANLLTRHMNMELHRVEAGLRGAKALDERWSRSAIDNIKGCPQQPVPGQGQNVPSFVRPELRGEAPAVPPQSFSSQVPPEPEVRPLYVRKEDVRNNGRTPGCGG